MDVCLQVYWNISPIFLFQLAQRNEILQKVTLYKIFPAWYQSIDKKELFIFDNPLLINNKRRNYRETTAEKKRPKTWNPANLLPDSRW